MTTPTKRPDHGLPYVAPQANIDLWLEAANLPAEDHEEDWGSLVRLFRQCAHSLADERKLNLQHEQTIGRLAAERDALLALASWVSMLDDESAKVSPEMLRAMGNDAREAIAKATGGAS